MIKKAMVWGSLVGLLLVGMLLVLPWFFNPDYLQSLVLRHIQQTLGSHVQVGRTSLSFFPSPHFLVSDIVVKEQADSHAVFRAQTLSLELGIGQLLQRKIVVKDFVLDYPEIEIHRDKLGVWRFLRNSNHDSTLSFLASFLVLGKIEIMNGKIILIDESPSDSVRGVVIENVACVSDTIHDDLSVHSNVELSGNLRQAQDSATFHLFGTFEGKSGVPLTSLARKNVALEQMTFAGTIDVQNMAMNQFAEFVSRPEMFRQFSGRLKAGAQFKWIKRGTTSQLHLRNIALINPAFSLAGTANVEGLEDGHQMTSVSLRSSSLNLELIRQAVPLSWLPNSLATIWENGQWGGNLKVLDARVTSSTRADVDTSVTGTFQVNQGFLSLPEWPKTEHVQGTIVVEPDRIHLSNANGVYDGIPVDITKGVVLLKDGGVMGEVEIEGPVPAEKVWAFTRNLMPLSTGTSEWQDLKILQGSGQLHLRFAGTLSHDQEFAFQHGEYQPANVIAKIPGFPNLLSNGYGKIQFSSDSTVFENISGDIGRSSFTVNGTLLHQDKLRLEPLVLTASLEGKELFISPEPVATHMRTSLIGPLHTTMTLRGPLSRLNFKGKVDGERVKLTIPSVLSKEVGQAGVLEFDGQLQSGETVQFERLELVMLPLRLRGQGIIRSRPTWSWEGRLDSGPISLGVLPEKLQVLGDAIQSGIFEVQLGGNGVGSDWTSWNLKGWVALTDGRIVIPGISAPIENVFVRLRIDKDLLDLKRMELHIKDSEAVITGFAKRWNSSPQVSVMWNAPRFDIDLLIPKEERSVLRDGVEWLANNGRLDGSFIIENPRYHTFSGNKLSAVITIHDNLVSVDKIQTMVESTGSAKGRVFIHLPPGKPAAVRASFEGSNLLFEQVLKTIGDDRELISGRMDIRGKVQGHGRDNRGIIPTLEGQVEFSLRNGYVRKGRVLPKILSILNLPHVLRGKVNFEKTGFPYDLMGGTLVIKEGLFSTKDFQLRSPVMNATTVGKYDFQHDLLDGVVAVSPFGAYSDALKSIPLFGTIISGDRKGIATAMFRLDGPLKEPQVVYMPNESFRTGLTGLAQLAFDVLKNTVLAPVDMLKGTQKDSPATSQLFSPRDDTPPDADRGSIVK